MDSSFNVILFGEVGAGKSSVINLIADKDVAKTSGGCTFESKQYMFEMEKRIFNIWVTMGLGEPTFSVSNFLGAIEKTYALIGQIKAQGGLDLLLFCIPGSRVTTTMQYNYRLFFEVLCEKRIPIAAVVTRLEDEERMEEWWDRNVQYLNQLGLEFSGHACVTGQRGHLKAAESRSALVSLLQSYVDKRRDPMPRASNWFSGFLERLPKIPRSGELKDRQRALRRLLHKRCEVHPADAKRLAEILACSPLRPAQAYKSGQVGARSSFNIVLFGEAGVGKSSVINLIADKEVAETSGDARGCTLESKQHTFLVAERTFNIWDTIGLGEPLISVTNYLGAIEKTYSLIQQIEAEGGLDLLLFCIPGSRITQTMLCNYRLFFEVFCEKRIPISVVVTRLEGEAKMEEWWIRNEEYINESGLRFGGHACITGQREHPNATQGRAALELLLLGYDHKGRYPMPPASDWFSGFLERLPALPRSKEVNNRRKDIERLLRERCMMERAEAQRLAEALTRPHEEDS